VQLDKLNEIIQVSDGDSIIAAQKMAKQLGLAVGISSGCNVVGAIKLKEKLGDNAVVTTFLPDDNKKYLSTDLVCEEPMKDEYVSKDLVFEGFHTIKRLSESIIPQ
jgi:cysteine synthase